MEYLEGETLASLVKRLKPAGGRDKNRKGPQAQQRALTTLAGLLEAEAVDAKAQTVASEGQRDAEGVTKSGPESSAERDGAPDSKASSDSDDITPSYCRRLAEAFAGVAEGLH